MIRINLMLMIIALTICCFELSQVGGSASASNSSIKLMKRQTLTDVDTEFAGDAGALGKKILDDSRSLPDPTNKPNRPVGKTAVTNKTEIPSLVMVDVDIPCTGCDNPYIYPMFTGVALSPTRVLAFIPITNLLAFASEADGDINIFVYENSQNFDDDANFGPDPGSNNFRTFDPEEKATSINVDYSKIESIQLNEVDTGLYILYLKDPLSSTTPITPDQLPIAGLTINPSTCFTYGFGPRETFGLDPTALNKVSTPLLCNPEERDKCVAAVDGISAEIRAANPRLANFKVQPYSICAGKLGDGKGDYNGPLERGDLGGLLICDKPDGSGQILVGLFAGEAAQVIGLATGDSVPAIFIDASNPIILEQIKKILA